MTYLIDTNCLETFVCELSRIDRLGTNRRLIFTVPDAGGQGEKAIVCKMIVSAAYLPTLIRMLEQDAYDRSGIAPELLALETGKAN